MTKQKKAYAVERGAVESMIFVIRGKKVMIDRDLAKLYEIETRVFNQAVRRNVKRFPEDFMFQLNADELAILKSQIVTSSWGGARKLPLVFTEQGVAMLSSVLNSERAIQVNNLIMRTFTKLMEMIFSSKERAYQMRKLERKVGRHDEDINVIIDVIKKLMQEPQKFKNGIGFHVK